MQQVVRAAKALGYETRDGKISMDDGREEPVVAIQVNNFLFIGRDSGHNMLALYMPRMVPEEIRGILKKEDPVKLERFMVELRATLLQGRTGFNFIFEDKVLKEIRLEQVIILADTSPATLQRIQDAIQEMIVVQARVGTLFGWSFKGVKAVESTGMDPQPPPDGMYA